MLANIARGYGRALVLRKPTLRIIEFSITAACQSRCEYCYAAKLQRRGGRILDVDEIRQTWRQAKALGAFSSLLLGGEPTLHPRFMDIIEVLQPRDHIVTFVTNGISLTEAMIVELRRLGVFIVFVSLNSLDPETNDRMRGYEGHLEHAMRVIDLCRKHGLDVAIPVTTAKPWLDETLRLLDFARRHGLQANINLFAATGRGEGKKDDLFPPSFWTELRRIYDTNPDLRGDWDTNLTLEVGCPAGYEKVHVAPYGDVTGCSIQPVSFGNVRTTPLAEIVARMRRFHHFAKRSPSCIVALDEEFIGDYVDPSMHHESTPYDVTTNACYPRDAVLRR